MSECGQRPITLARSGHRKNKSIHSWRAPPFEALLLSAEQESARVFEPVSVHDSLDDLQGLLSQLHLFFATQSMFAPLFSQLLDTVQTPGSQTRSKFVDLQRRRSENRRASLSRLPSNCQA